MSISKRGNAYVELDEALRTSNVKDARMELTINITLGKRMERDSIDAIEKFIATEMKQVNKDFKKFIKKQSSKLLDDDE